MEHKSNSSHYISLKFGTLVCFMLLLGLLTKSLTLAKILAFFGHICVFRPINANYYTFMFIVSPPRFFEISGWNLAKIISAYIHLKNLGGKLGENEGMPYIICSLDAVHPNMLDIDFRRTAWSNGPVLILNRYFSVSSLAEKRDNIGWWNSGGGQEKSGRPFLGY